MDFQLLQAFDPTMGFGKLIRNILAKALGISNRSQEKHMLHGSKSTTQAIRAAYQQSLNSLSRINGGLVRESHEM